MKKGPFSHINGSGIYYILNRGNNRIYVGESAAIGYRFNEHVYGLNTHRHSNMLLQHDWDVFGSQAFEFGVLAEAPDIHNQPLHERPTTWRRRHEQIFMNVYQSFNPDFGYNLIRH